jgi:predicted ATPase
LASDLIALSREQGSTDWELAGEILLGWQEAQDGALHEGLERIQRGVDGVRARKLNVWLPAYLLLQATVYCDAGRFDEALRLLDEAKELMELQDHRSAQRNYTVSAPAPNCRVARALRW